MIISLVAIAVFTSLRYVNIMLQNNSLRDQLQASKFYSSSLEDRIAKQKKQYEDLLEDVEVLEAGLKQKGLELETALKELSDLDKKIMVLGQENTVLRQDLDLTSQDRDKLHARLETLIQEKADLEEKFNTIEGLKQAIRDLKLKMRQARRQAARRQSGSEKRGKPNSDLSGGNRGYLILDGQSTFSPKVRIKVSPVP